MPLWELKEKKGETGEERADRVLRILQGATALNCPKCGGKVEKRLDKDPDWFVHVCLKCGYTFDRTKIYGPAMRNRSKKCPRCGALNNPELKNCFNCGTDIRDVEAKRHRTGRLEPEQT